MHIYSAAESRLHVDASKVEEYIFPELFESEARPMSWFGGYEHGILRKRVDIEFGQSRWDSIAWKFDDDVISEAVSNTILAYIIVILNAIL